MQQFNAFGAKKDFECHSAAGANATATPPHHRPQSRMHPIGCGRWTTERLSFAVHQFVGPATATGSSRTDPYSVTPLRAAGASRCA
jgi:hypothetical protein